MICTETKGIPKKEIVWVKHTTVGGDVYYITSNETRSMYYLYKYENGTASKVGRGAKSPSELEQTYID